MATVMPQAITLRLGPDLKYTPDFLVVENEVIECHETKGAYIREDGRAKFLAATSLFPFIKWTLAVWKDGDWSITTYETNASRVDRTSFQTITPRVSE